MTKIKVICASCGKPFEKSLKEFNRCKKKNMKHCCNRSCTAEYRNSIMTDDYWKQQYEKQKRTFDIKSLAGNLSDEYSPFRKLLSRGRASIKAHKNEIDIDEKYLKELWEKQNGICPYTGIKMILAPSSARKYKIRSLKKASLDRIDSSKGYLKGNVEFVCYFINNAKNNFSKKDTLNFINEIHPQNTISVTQEQPT